MSKRLFWITALAAISLPAMAGFETVSRAYEVALGDLRIPTSQHAAVRFSECDDCESVSARLTPNTRFVVNGRTVDFDRFRQLAAGANDADSIPVIVLHHLESDTVTKISVTLK